jgi:hypothetical protein
VAYLNVTSSVERDTHMSHTDRPHPEPQYSRIVNLEVGPICLMLSGNTEAETNHNLVNLLDHVTTLLAASSARLKAEAAPKGRVRANTDADPFYSPEDVAATLAAHKAEQS